MTLFQIWRAAPLLAVLTLACHRQPEPPGTRETPRPASSDPKGQGAPPEAFLAPPPATARAREVPPLAWTDPPGWSRAPSPSQMRLATYRVPKAKGDSEDAEMTVFHFGAGQGGGTDANFDRWVSQFHGVDRSKTRRSERTVNGLSAHVLEIETGSFVSAARPGEPEILKDHYGLLGAIVETPGGPYFFKLTGPNKTLKAAREAFFALLDGVKQA